MASKFFPIDAPDGKQSPLCERDYFKRLNLICAKCSMALRGSYITACSTFEFSIKRYSSSLPLVQTRSIMWNISHVPCVQRCSDHMIPTTNMMETSFVIFIIQRASRLNVSAAIVQYSNNSSRLTVTVEMNVGIQSVI